MYLLTETSGLSQVRSKTESRYFSGKITLFINTRLNDGYNGEGTIMNAVNGTLDPDHT